MDPSSDSSPWRKSSHSGPNGCVEAVRLPNGLIGVRDSKQPQGGVLTYTPHEWRAFLAGVRDNQFDDLAITPPGGIALPGVSATETNHSRA
jgi:hypothetical protein